MREELEKWGYGTFERCNSLFIKPIGLINRNAIYDQEQVLRVTNHLRTVYHMGMAPDMHPVVIGSGRDEVFFFNWIKSMMKDEVFFYGYVVEFIPIFKNESDRDFWLEFCRANADENFMGGAYGNNCHYFSMNVFEKFFENPS